MKKRINVVSLLVVCLLAAGSSAMLRDPDGPRFPKREFRAVWIATVDNIDWPSRKNLPPEEQRREFENLLDFHKQNGLNAVFVQVRAAGDAFYAKSAEPWSEWLTGKQGREPYPFYDPLEYMTAAAHSRGLEFHAWLNLNRLVHKSSLSVSKYNISNLKPEWVLEYDGYKLFDFGLPEVRDFITEAVVNIVRHYDVDGIHFDDYFYPYAVPGKVLKDDKTFRLYGEGFKNKADWRRNNTDLLIEQIYKALLKENPRIKFGISPFGVWRNKRDDPDGSETTGGLASYDHLYADARKWLKEGWIDYIIPQVYFSFGFKRVPYANLVDWWADNRFGRHLYIGHAAYRVGNEDTDKNWGNPEELPKQLRYSREKQVDGDVFFSSRSMKRNRNGLTDSIRSSYRYPALIPAMPWKDSIPPLAPTGLEAAFTAEGLLEISWNGVAEKAEDGELPWYHVVYRFQPDEKAGNTDPSKIIGIVNQVNYVIDSTAVPGARYVYYVTAVDRLHNESRPAGPLRIQLKVVSREEDR